MKFADSDYQNIHLSVEKEKQPFYMHKDFPLFNLLREHFCL